MKTLEKPHLSEMAADAIINFILENDLKPADCIPTEKEISILLGIGKTSVREGIAALKSAGLLQSRQGGRVYVKEINFESMLRPKSSVPLFAFLKMSKKEELDLIATRKIIEVAAMKEALQKNKDVKDATVNTLRNLHARMAASLDNVNMFIQHDRAFHKEILAASGNFLLPIMFDLLGDLYSKQFMDVSRLPEAMNRALVFHEKVCLAIENGATQEAVEWLDKHLTDMEQRLERL